MDAAERELLESTVRGAIAGAGHSVAAGSVSVPVSVVLATETATEIEATAVDAVLAGLGWLEMLAAEPRDTIAIVFTALGSTGATATVLDDVVVAALGLPPRPDLAVMLPSFGGWAMPGRVEDGECRGVGLATARAAIAPDVLVVGDGTSVTVPISSADVRAVHGIDPDGGFHTVHVKHTVGIDVRFDAVTWDAAVATGRHTVAHQIAGACRTMLDLARTHAVERVQFGRPIAGFQAVRHRLADALVAIEALEATLDAAADDPGDLTAALAKATAGRTAATVATHCQQVLAGTGFTTDHPFHRFLKRTMMLDGLFGSAEEITVDIGRQLIAARRVPTLIEL